VLAETSGAGRPLQLHQPQRVVRPQRRRGPVAGDSPLPRPPRWRAPTAAFTRFSLVKKNPMPARRCLHGRQRARLGVRVCRGGAGGRGTGRQRNVRLRLSAQRRCCTGVAKAGPAARACSTAELVHADSTGTARSAQVRRSGSRRETSWEEAPPPCRSAAAAIRSRTGICGAAEASEHVSAVAELGHGGKELGVPCTGRAAYRDHRSLLPDSTFCSQQGPPVATESQRFFQSITQGARNSQGTGYGICARCVFLRV
jgi:hypothetical protein